MMKMTADEEEGEETCLKSTIYQVLDLDRYRLEMLDRITLDLEYKSAFYSNSSNKNLIDAERVYTLDLGNFNYLSVFK